MVSNLISVTILESKARAFRLEMKKRRNLCSIAFARRKLKNLASVREAIADRGWRVPVRAYENVNDGEVKY